MPRFDNDAGLNCRYSGCPQSHYVNRSKNVEYGSAASVLINTLQAWNLAYLSFDFEKKHIHPDPNFTVYVRRSIQTRLVDGTLDLVEPEPYFGLVGSLLLKPAPRFVYVIKNLTILKSLPLYAAYGKDWMDTIEERSWICGYDRTPDALISDISIAEGVLAKYRLTKA